MISVGLNLLTVALEVGSDALATYPTLLALVKDTLCQNLFSVGPALLIRFTLSPTLDRLRCSTVHVFIHLLRHSVFSFSSSKVFERISNINSK